MRSVFIANRGEIAYRILRSAKRLGLRVIAGVSEVDQYSRVASEADDIVLLGAAPSSESYLNIEKVVAAAIQSGADAVHPGYGFLSENASFATAIEKAGMAFVGPSAAVIAAMGDKLQARATAIEAGLPVVPGGEANDIAAAIALAQNIGFPLLIKAAAGGGGRGMQLVHTEAELAGKISVAMAEAQAAFGDKRVYFERYIAKGRHVEVQVLGDGLSAIHLGTRDCSIQRHYQKLVEEAPAPGLPDEVRHQLQEAAVNLAAHLGYQGAGTVEFLVDAESFSYYFLEMNVRIQVEHPVTEMITGIDLVEQQLLIASGARLGIKQFDVNFQGHAIEVRVNAEDPMRDFMPSPGRVNKACWPAGCGIRVDSHIRSGDSVPINYDSLLGKVIVHGQNRQQALDKMRLALSSMRIEGVATTQSLHKKIMDDVRFQQGGVDTRFFEAFTHG